MRRLHTSYQRLQGDKPSDDHYPSIPIHLMVMPKVRVFWRRVVRGILPDECSLQHCHIKESNTCRVCFAMEEDLMHALLHCSYAKRFWAEAYVSCWTYGCLDSMLLLGLVISYVSTGSMMLSLRSWSPLCGRSGSPEITWHTMSSRLIQCSRLGALERI